MTEHAPPKPRKKPGPPKGTRPAGRAKGTKNLATVEREAKIKLEQERLALLEKMAKEGANAVDVAQLQGKKLMKEIAFDFAGLFAGLAAFYQPYPTWTRDAAGKVVNANPNFNEQKFLVYAKLATETALGAAAYESPKLAAVMIQQNMVNEIEVTGGLPDAQDGGLVVEDQSAAEPAAESPVPDPKPDSEAAA
jgi:hypothetical protein